MNQSYAEILSAIDIINIPVHGGPVVGAFWVLSFACAIPVFVMSCIYEYTKFIKNDPKDQPDFYGTALRVLVFVIAFLVYGAVMKIAYFFDFISMTIVSWSDWSEFMTRLNQIYAKSNGTSLLNFHFSSFLMYITLFLAIISETMLMGLRFISLYVAYCVGPFLLLLGIYRPLRDLTNGWLTYFFQISFWPIIMKLLQSAVLSFQFKSFVEGGNTFVITLISLLMVIMYFTVPALAAIFLSQKNMGALVEGAAGAAKSLAAGGLGAAAGAVTGFAAGAMEEASGAAKAAGSIAAGAPKASDSPAQSTISAGDTPGNDVKDDKPIEGTGSKPTI